MNLNLFIAYDRVSKQNIHPCLKSRIVGYSQLVEGLLNLQDPWGKL